MNELIWFCFGLSVGLLADFLLVLHMIKPLKKRIFNLEKGAFLCNKCLCNLEVKNDI